MQNVPVFRYDHLSVLCELMPVALPSLASCLQTLCLGQFNTEAQTAVTKRLGISSVEVEEIGRQDPTQSHTKMCVSLGLMVLFFTLPFRSSADDSLFPGRRLAELIVELSTLLNSDDIRFFENDM